MTRIYQSQQECPVAQTLNIVGDRWTVLVLRDLFRGCHRFNDLLASLDGISPNLLAERLKRLEDHGIVERVFYSKHPPRAEYHLTEKGEDFGGVLREMMAWGEKYGAREPGASRSGASLEPRP